MLFKPILKIVIKNLVFVFDEASGDLRFKEAGHRLASHSSLMANLKESKLKEDLEISENWGANGMLKNMKLAQVSYANVLQGIHKAANNRFFVMPCNLDWSTANSRRFALSLKRGKCLRFIASSFGDIFVVFSTNPYNEYTWYFVQISSYGVAIYKVMLP